MSNSGSAAMYRRRRISVLIILALLVYLVWLGVSSLGSWLAGPSSGQACPPGTVTVSAQVGDSAGNPVTKFAAGELPYMWFTLTNKNSVDCTFNAGPKVQYFKIKSGEEQIWTSMHCDRADLKDGKVVLKAGAVLTGTPSAWEKVFSTQEGCGVGQDPVTTKGASYRLFAEVNGELSVNEVQFVLD